jgi:hypothetical protein
MEGVRDDKIEARSVQAGATAEEDAEGAARDGAHAGGQGFTMRRGWSKRWSTPIPQDFVVTPSGIDPMNDRARAALAQFKIPRT